MQKSLHHSFDIQIAEEYGIEEAILIHHFQHWISINQKLKRNFHDGCYWSYQSLDEIAAHFPYMKKERIFNLLDRLCTGKSRFAKKEKDFEPVLKKGNYNQSKYDRTVWYAFCDSTKWILWKHNIENGDTQSQDGVSTTPIPDTKPNTETVSINIDTRSEKTAPHFVSFGSSVKLKQEEYESLCSLNTEPLIKTVIEEINDYIASKGLKPYKDYAATIRNWIRRRKTESPTQTSSSTKQTNLETFRAIGAVLAKKGKYCPISLKGNYIYHNTGDSISLDLACETFTEVLCSWTGVKKT